jgi:hypothetical protein
MAARYIPNGLLIHFLTIGTILLLIYLILRREHLFHWLSTGFWAWTAFTFYFFIAPLIQYWGDPHYMEIYLAPTEGLPRMIWVTWCVAVGIAMFFWAYFRSRPAIRRYGLNQESWPTGTWMIIILSLAGAAYTLVVYRGAFGFEMTQVDIEGSSKFVGKVTGYEYGLNLCASFPIILLTLRRSTRVLGLACAGIMVLGKINDRFDRATAVSIFIGISMVLTLVRRSKWPSRLLIVCILLLTMFLQARGHYSYTEFRESGKMTVATSRGEVKKAEGAVMLSMFYLKSYLHDKVGYTYGIPLVSAVAFGALPRKYFPWKDWMVETYLSKINRAFGLETIMFGSKSTVIGDLYGFGGIFAIAGGMFILGFLTRKLDGWLAPQAPTGIRAMGIVWLSYLWMILGSALLWTATLMFLTIIPFVAVVLCAKVFGTSRRLAMVRS